MSAGTDPAFPVSPQDKSPGLTKREFIAGLILAGILANHSSISELSREAAETEVSHPDPLVRIAVRHADELLEELSL